ITPGIRTGRIPLSYSQESLWVIDKVWGSLQYHMPAVLEINGTLNIPALRSAIGQLVERHEVLRTVISEEDGKAFQTILSETVWDLDTATCRFDTLQAKQKYIDEFMRIPFQMDKEPLFRTRLITTATQSHLLLVLMHHIVSDGWSASIFIKELSALYTAACTETPHTLQPLPVQYADFAIWQRKYISGQQLEQQTQFWKNRLQGVQPIQLQTDFPRPPVQSTNGQRIEHMIDPQLSADIMDACRRQGVTLYMFLLCAFKTLLMRYTAQQDICVGTSTAGRLHGELEGLIGYFVNTLAIRSQVDPQNSFSEQLALIRENLLECYAHQEVPFEKVVDAVEHTRDLAQNPIFQVMFVLLNTPEEGELSLGEASVKPISIRTDQTKFDLTLKAEATGESISLSMEYCADLFTAERISAMTQHLVQLLGEVTHNPAQKLQDIRIMGTQEREQVLAASKGPVVRFPKDKTVIDLFRNQVDKNPENTAVSFRGKKLTYRDLQQQVSKAAAFLNTKGITNGDIVAICMERSEEMITAILAIMSAGAAYVPIDPAYPKERIDFIIKDTNAKILITDID
ncbi:HxxPF-repeated domain-containing protein, partial [Pedobacter terrae]